MTFSLRRVDVITVFAEDVAETKSFYEEVLGLPVTFENEDSAVFTLENMLVNVLHVSGGPELVAPATIGDPDAGSRFVLAMFVDDVDEACAELAERGVMLLNGPVDRPWGVRTASFTDPAGHIWEIAQDLE
jgi:catechol 2,3-dioxygenase-like lactoylglutathione lyase family enzyme